MTLPEPSTSHAHIERVPLGPVTYLAIQGVIDETFSPAAAAAGLSGHVIVDLGRVERISSFGVRQWMTFVRERPPGTSGLWVVHAPPVVVDQLSMVEGFAGASVVLSVLAPYRCPRCKEDRLRVIDLRREAAALGQSAAPARTCTACASSLEFADVAEEFFAFLRRHAPAPPDPAVDEALALLSGAPAAGSGSALKIVEGDLTFVRLAGTLRGDLSVRRLAGGVEGRAAYDFAFVRGAAPEAIGRLREVFALASERARVYLWRVPPAIAAALLAPGLPRGTAIASLWIEATCRCCGETRAHRVRVAEPPRGRAAAVGSSEACRVCGAPAAAVATPEAAPLLAASAAVDAPWEAIELLELRALAQSLGDVNAAMTPTPAPAATPEPARPPAAAPVPAPAEEGPRLQLLRLIGQGGMAEVFLARQAGLKGFEKYVVVKRILPHLARTRSFVEMLFAEARAQAHLNHPNIVQIHDVGVLDGAPYISMEYVRGADLGTLMRALIGQGVSLPTEHALRIAAEIAGALDHAHAYVDPVGQPHPVVHRDVSPHNILLSVEGAVKLTDFGVAKVMGEAGFTEPGTFKGKIGYVSPETVQGTEIDGRADLFSLGVVLYELLTMRAPFRKSTEAATVQAIARDPPAPPDRLNPAVPGDVAGVVLRSLEKRPEHRFQTGGVLREAIEALMARHGYRSTPASVARFFAGAVGAAFDDQAAAAASATPTRPARQADAGRATPSRPMERPWQASIGSTPVATPSGPRPPPGPPPSGDGNPRRAAAGQPPVDAFREPSGRGKAEATPVVPFSAVAQRGARPEPAGRIGPVFPAHGPSVDRDGSPEVRADTAEAGAASPRSVRARWVVGAVVAAAVAAAVVWGATRFRATGAVRVENLAPDERLYLDAVHVDARAVTAGRGSSLRVVAIGRGGALVRLGTVAASSDAIDASALPEIRVAPGERASLAVSSDPKGCSVVAGGERVPSATPVATSIDSGKEVLVEVMCPGLPRWTRWVLATPGQTVTLSARLLDQPF